MATLPPKEDDPYKLKCLIIDDEPIAVRGIINYINALGTLEIVGHCSTAMEASEALKANTVDLLFLDINMPYLTGLEFLESLENPPLCIITTAYAEYALEGFRLNVVDYLMKPISFQRFFQAVSKAREIFRSELMLKEEPQESNSDMYVRQGDSFQRIRWMDILYIESMQNYLKIHFKDEALIIHQTMASIEAMLPKDYFFRIHRSYLINVSHIDTISGGRVIVGGKELPLSRQRRDELLNSVVYKNLISK
ncbi:LytTR family DNA-binding domain-containing protein [Cesiribacter sp. SM1]|uniref:LytR/AlgR family response regulator transcription factor n=1 Tax=Cesiribacter sp. SM1 TaxID=2861196 RepID=UPI001CD670C3|nr:LytTR family DNA-binding domain-containing protein [Cesiribacter sp. SM1]